MSAELCFINKFGHKQHRERGSWYLFRRGTLIRSIRMVAYFQQRLKMTRFARIRIQQQHQ